MELSVETADQQTDNCHTTDVGSQEPDVVEAEESDLAPPSQAPLEQRTPSLEGNAAWGSLRDQLEALQELRERAERELENIQAGTSSEGGENLTRHDVEDAATMDPRLTRLQELLAECTSSLDRVRGDISEFRNDSASAAGAAEAAIEEPETPRELEPESADEDADGDLSEVRAALMEMYAIPSEAAPEQPAQAVEAANASSPNCMKCETAHAKDACADEPGEPASVESSMRSAVADEAREADPPTVCDETLAEVLESFPENNADDDDDMQEVRAALKELYDVPDEAQTNEASNSLSAASANETAETPPMPESAETHNQSEAIPETAGEGIELAAAKLLNNAAQQDDAPQSQTSQVPDAAASTSAQQPEVAENDGNDPDSVAAYMERLLKRQRKPGDDANVRELLRASRGESNRGSEQSAVESKKESELKKPSKPRVEPTPQDKAEIRAGMSSMRELANLQARQAVAKHQWKRALQKTKLYGALTGGGFLVTIGLLTAGLFGASIFLPTSAIVFLIACGSSVQYFRSMSATRNLASMLPTSKVQDDDGGASKPKKSPVAVEQAGELDASSAD